MEENSCQELSSYQYDTTLSIISGIQGVAVSEETNIDSIEEYSDSSLRILPGLSGIPRNYTVLKE